MAKSTKVSNTISNTSSSYLNKIESEIQSNQSRLNMILGALIVLVIGILVFNYFSKSKSDLGPAQSTTSTEKEDVTVNDLPGKYTVKEGDTLFEIANIYYGDGYKFEEIAKANNLTSVDMIEVGQILEIPKLEMTTLTTAPVQTDIQTEVSQNEWGAKITESTYTIQEGDWLSTIAGRAYGDIYAYDKIAKANNISDPNNIEPGIILTIPR